MPGLKRMTVGFTGANPSLSLPTSLSHASHLPIRRSRMTRWILVRLLITLCVGLAPVPVFAAQLPDSMQMAELNDEELSVVTAGEFAINIEGFDVVIQDNEASGFTMNIAQDAFNNAQGIFTTVQAVNSAVNLSMIVNIYLNQQPTS